MYLSDLHIHSRYSYATSRDLCPETLDLWARKKGIDLLGTGDFTHPAWRQELKDKLVPAEEGLYTLRNDLRLPDPAPQNSNLPRFVISGEISSIYKKNGRTRKVHSLILLPGLKEADSLSAKLEQKGNISSDGRPILNLDCHDLLAMTLEVCPEAIFIPAHIWTPHFSLLGERSGFDTIEECFEELTPYIRALETGLSSDPAMNRQVRALDRFHLVSNSDAHSPSRLGREATLLAGPLSYQGLYEAVQLGNGLAGTIEFFPEEGKYHYDGHRSCGVCLSPSQAEKAKGLCPVCGKKLTPGVLHRIMDLAGEGFSLPEPSSIQPPYQCLAPLPELISAIQGTASPGVRAMRAYEHALMELGNEFYILRNAPEADIAHVLGPETASGIRRLRAGMVRWQPGFDGVYGSMELFEGQQDV